MRELGVHAHGGAALLAPLLLELPSRVNLGAMQVRRDHSYDAGAATNSRHALDAVTHYHPSTRPTSSLQMVNAGKVEAAVVAGINALPAGAHAAPLAALLAPRLRLLAQLATAPADAVAAAAASGALLAAATHCDGVTRSAQLRDLGIDEAAAESIVAEGRARGGAVSWPHPAMRAEKVRSIGRID